MLLGKLPSFHIVRRRSVERSCRSANLYLRIFLVYCLADHQATVLKHGGYDVLIAYSYIFQVERLWMTSVGSHLCPLVCGRVAVSPLYHVHQFLNVVRHVLHRYSSLLSAKTVGVGSGVLTWHTGSEHWQRLRSNVLTELEILEESESASLMIAPDVSVGNTVVERTHGMVPVVDIVKSVAVAHAASWETHKLRVQVGNRLRKVASESVLSSLECILREEAYHV